MLDIDIRDFGNFQLNKRMNVSVSEASSTTGSAYNQNSKFSIPSTIEFNALENNFAESRLNQITLQ